MIEENIIEEIRELYDSEYSPECSPMQAADDGAIGLTDARLLSAIPALLDEYWRLVNERVATNEHRQDLKDWLHKASTERDAFRVALRKIVAGDDCSHFADEVCRCAKQTAAAALEWGNP